MIKVIGRKDILEIIGMFLIVQFLGVAIAALVVYTSTLSLIQAGITSGNTAALSYILDGILVITVSFLFINRHRRHHQALQDNIFFITLEAVVVIATSFFFFLYIFDLLLPASYLDLTFFLALASAITLISAKDLDPKIRNIVTMISSMGVGLLLGLYLSFEYALIGLAFVAVYDYISVFITKSMIKLARAVTTRNMAMIISTSHLEAISKDKFSVIEVKEYTEYLEHTHKDQDPAYKRILALGRIPVLSQLSLGEGDLGIPLMVGVSAYYTFASPFISIMIIIGGLCGLISAIVLLKFYRGALPAIPPLFTFISIFSGIALFVTGKLAGPYQNVYLAVAGVAIISFGLMLRIVVRRSAKMSKTVAGARPV